MVKRRTLSPAPVFDRKALLQCLQDNQIKESHAAPMLQFLAKLHQKKVAAVHASAPTTADAVVPVEIEIGQLDNLHGIPQKSSHVLKETFSPCTSKVVGHQRSADGSTHKLLVELQDGQRVESCIMVYGSGCATNCQQDDEEEDEFWDCEDELRQVSASLPR